MMSGIQITGILLLLAMLGLLIFFILFGRLGWAVIPRMVYGKRIRWTVTGYMVLLLVATVAVYLTPKSDLINEKAEGPSFDFWEIGHELYKAADNGELDEIFDQYIVSKQQTEVTDDSLDVQWQPMEDEELPIIVDMKDNDDSMVNVTLYQTPTIVDGIVVTDESVGLRLETSSADVKLLHSGNKRIELISFKQEFPVRQFTGEHYWMGNAIQRGESVLFMRVPQDLQVNYPHAANVSYVGE